ncbi:MAG: replication endonuclease [Burkholderiales bacterium]
MAAQAYLCELWAKARAALLRAGIRPYGFRIAEPQHDGTPHWHMVLFCPPAHIDPLGEILRRYALAVDSSEPGAQEHRFRVEVVDHSNGSATGYVAKYVSKNIYAAPLEGEEPGIVEKVQRVRAWASTWRIRQFQQIGGPIVSVWREARRVAPPKDSGVLTGVSEAANKSLWCDYVSVMGGSSLPRKDRPVRLAREWHDLPGRYEEPIGFRVFGIEGGDHLLRTRLHSWHVVPEPSRQPGPRFRPLEFCQYLYGARGFLESVLSIGVGGCEKQRKCFAVVEDIMLTGKNAALAMTVARITFGVFF